MILKLIVDDQLFELNVPDALVEQAEDFFRKMDADMDAGWQMGREWVDAPDKLQRCQIVADKLLTALEKEDDTLGRMMAGYILSRAPEIETVEPDTAGEMQNTRFELGQTRPGTPAAAPSAAEPARPPDRPARLNRMEALAQAGKEVSKVFRVGKQWRFSLFDPETGNWEDSPLTADQSEAERLRELAFKRRFEALSGQGD